MLKLTRLFLLVPAVFVNPAMAACNLLLADVPALTECVRDQGYAISNQAEEIAQLRKELGYLREFQDHDRKSIDRLSKLIDDLQLEVVQLGGWKTKPAKK